MKVWMRGRLAFFTASQQRSISLKLARDRPQITAFSARRAISLVDGRRSLGRILGECSGDPQAAAAVFDRGIAAATRAGDAHARGELEAARGELS